MAMIEQNGKKSLTLIHVRLIFQTLNCVHSYSKLKLTAGKAFVQYLKMFLLKAKSARGKKIKTSFFFLENWTRENITVIIEYLSNRGRSPGLSHHGERRLFVCVFFFFSCLLTLLGERPLKWHRVREIT